MKRINDRYFFTCPICGKKPYVKTFNLNYGIAYCKGSFFNKHPLIQVKTDYCNPSNLYNVLSKGWNNVLWEPLNNLPIYKTVR